ncbi:MAG: selenocysteine-specific translation elongation factor [Campylobacterales bacterium]|nr:selenocysteine-specific translation elongation factor [Campylobacterales bacterium]
MNRLIIGTAGHIDHGKTSMIKALSGFEGDATPEEKRRGITIDLSFSSIQKDGTEISFIDVPGHEKLVKTMIGGAFGFDYALVVIDAIEGIMPQTIEHVSILNTIKQLGVLAVITKSDLADQDTINKRHKEVREFFADYANLRLVDILDFSVKNDKQIENLRNRLFNLKKELSAKDTLIRLYVDRSFALQGVGCVVTGTLLGGELKAKESLYIPSMQKSVKVRSIQTHSKTVEAAYAGQRTAINLSDISHTEIKKGVLITQKGFLRGFKTIEALLKPAKNQKIEHNQELIAYFGTQAVGVRVLIIEELENEYFVSLKFKHDMFTIFDEPFVLRNSTHTVGGGNVVSAVADPIKKRQKLSLMNALLKKDFEKAFEILLEAHKTGFGLICSIQRFGITHEDALAIAMRMSNVVVDEKALVIYPKIVINELQDALKKIYTKNKLAMLSPSSVKFKLPWASEYVAHLAFEKLVNDGFLIKENGLYISSGASEVDLIQKLSDKIVSILEDDGFAPPAPYNIYDEIDIDRATGDLILKKLCSSHKAVRLAHNHFVGSIALSKAMTKIRELIKQNGFADVGSVKDTLNISRKYAVNYLEYLDKFDDIENSEQKRSFKKHQ